MCEDFRRWKQINTWVTVEAVVFSAVLSGHTTNTREWLTASPAEGGHAAVPKGRNVQHSFSDVPRTFGAE